MHFIEKQLNASGTKQLIVYLWYSAKFTAFYSMLIHKICAPQGHSLTCRNYIYLTARHYTRIQITVQEKLTYALIHGLSLSRCLVATFIAWISFFFKIDLYDLYITLATFSLLTPSKSTYKCFCSLALHACKILC